MAEAVARFKAEQGLALKGAEGLNVIYELTSRLRRMNWYNLYPESVVFKRLNLVKTERFGKTVLDKEQSEATELVETEYKNFCLIHGKKYVPTSKLAKDNQNFTRSFGKNKGGYNKGSGNFSRPQNRGRGRGYPGANAKKPDYAQLLQQFAQAQQSFQFQDQTGKANNSPSGGGYRNQQGKKPRGGNTRGAGPKPPKK
jgi:hypothetical protein